jgi:hypothetical protein
VFWKHAHYQGYARSLVAHLLLVASEICHACIRPTMFVWLWGRLCSAMQHYPCPPPRRPFSHSNTRPRSRQPALHAPGKAADKVGDQSPQNYRRQVA